jgi:nucleoside-diphosphate-sugar epimerase
VLPDPGTPFQLVHTDDVRLALAAAVRGEGEPGIYNLAGAGTITTADLARAVRLALRPVPPRRHRARRGASSTCSR